MRTKSYLGWVLLGAACSSSSQAASLVTSAVAFSSGDVTVTDPYTTGGTATSQANIAAGTPSLTQFNPATGVLTGAVISIDSTRAQTVTGSATRNNSGGSPTASFAGSSSAKVTAPGVDNTFSTINVSTSCTFNQKNCGTVTNSSTIDTDLTVAASALGSYVGTGSVSANLSLPQVQSNMTTNASQVNGGNSAYKINWSGSMTATYNYLLHAAPSFDAGNSQNSLTLDFGTVTQNSLIAGLNFSLFNFAGDRTGLNLTGIGLSGDTSILGTDLALFSNLLQGQSNPFNASFDTSQLGTFNAIYTLALADYLPTGAAASTQQTYTMTLNLTGTVEAQAAVVPVPAAAWLFGAGLTCLGAVARRKTRTA